MRSSKARTNRETAAEDSAVYRNCLRVGMFSESFHPVQNGVTTSLLTLVSALRARKHHVFVFAPAHQQQQQSEANVLRFPSFVSVFNRDYPLAYPFFPRIALASHFADLRLNVVHTHTPFVLGLTGARLAGQHRLPLVTTFHTLYSRYSHYMPLLPENATQLLIEKYLPWYYNRCSQIICPSVVASRELRKLGVEQPIEVIPSGIPTPSRETVSASARSLARRRIGLEDNTPLLLYAGRLVREKHVDWLLEAFAGVRNAMPEARLALAGCGAEEEDLHARAYALGLNESVLFLGAQPRTELDSLYASADVFCFPSPSETQGLVIGEARAAGTPCVVMDAGGAPETVQHGEDGFRVPCGDIPQYSAAVLRILQQPELAVQMRQNARRNARKFTPDAMLEKVMKVYACALSHPTHQDTFKAPAADDPLLYAVSEAGDFTDSQT